MWPFDCSPAVFTDCERLALVCDSSWCAEVPVTRSRALRAAHRWEGAATRALRASPQVPRHAIAAAAGGDELGTRRCLRPFLPVRIRYKTVRGFVSWRARLARAESERLREVRVFAHAARGCHARGS